HFNSTATYLNGTMPEPERQILEARIEKDPEFRNQFLPYLMTELSVAIAVQKSQWARLRQYYHPARKSPIKIWPWIATLAACLLFFLLFRQVLIETPPRTSEELFAAYYEPYALPSPTRGKTTEMRQHSLGDRAMREGRMEDALIYYLASLEEDSLGSYKKGSIYMQMGTAYLTLDSLDLAVTAFQKGADAQSAMWYEALTWLKMERWNKTEALLEEILQYPEHYYYEKAKKLREELKN
ncbi:MAG: hypothetical protein AAF135_20765, partial [Bacteroidota bacterium]